MNAQGSKSKPLFTEINITPLTDIFLVLLIIIMIVAPIMSRSPQDIRPPDLDAGSPMDQRGFTLEIASDGAYYVEGSKLGEGELPDVLAKRLPTLKEKHLVVRGDAQSRSKALLAVLEAAQAAGFEKVFVAGEDRTRGSAADGAVEPGVATP